MLSEQQQRMKDDFFMGNFIKKESTTTINKNKTPFYSLFFYYFIILCTFLIDFATTAFVFVFWAPSSLVILFVFNVYVLCMHFKNIYSTF